MEVRSGLVKDHFGYWPEFADAKVVNFSWAQPGQIDLALHYVDADQGKDAIISLRFSGVSDVELSDLKSENVVDCLSPSPGIPISVELVACYGLCGTFLCLGVEVVGFEPNSSSKPTPLRGAA